MAKKQKKLEKHVVNFVSIKIMKPQTKSMQKKRGMINDTCRDNKFWAGIVLIFEFLCNLFPTRKVNRELIIELRGETRNLEYIKETNSKAYNDWIKYANRTRKLILHGNPNKFLQWAPIKDTMNVTNSKFIIEELNDLKKSPHWNSLWQNIIMEAKIGGQIPFIFYPQSSGNTIHLTYIISKFKEKTGKNFTDLDFIFEFGGGYGNLCRLIHKLGFRGKYIIFDLPIFSALQKFYLKSSGLPVYAKSEIDIQKKGVFCINNIKVLLEMGFPNEDKNLFIATWSLSETSLRVRATIEKFLSNFNYFMVGYQNRFGEVDNKEYLAKLKKEYNDIMWYDWPLKQLPAHNLLIGKKK
ncbi:MAG: hypothetical protein ABH841_00495 [Candidatus Nealsonbacteria bacterium]